jgi:putative membrane protein
MRSYILAITLTMFLSALFAYQNIEDVTVRFFIFEKAFPQGVWEVLVFCAGAAIMWIFSVLSMFEMRSKYKKEVKLKDEKIEALEEEKKTILESITKEHYSTHIAPNEEDIFATNDATQTDSETAE